MTKETRMKTALANMKAHQGRMDSVDRKINEKERRLRTLNTELDRLRKQRTELAALVQRYATEAFNA